MIEPIRPPRVPEGHATEEEGSVVDEGGELFSNLQQREEEEALQASLIPINYDQPSSSTLEEGVPAVVKILTLFQQQPVITVQNSSVSSSTE